MTLLESLLRGVKRGARELTIDCSAMTDGQRQRVVEVAQGLGLSAAGTRRWLLVREL